MWENRLNALLAIILALVLWGAFAIQFLKQETPCALCLLQRLGMLGVAIGALMNVRYGARRLHYGLCLFSAIFGGFVALRQISLHVCPQFPTFGLPFWGLSLYTWSFLVFCSSILYIGLLLMIFDPTEVSPNKPRSMDGWGKLAFGVIFLVTVTNIAATLWVCGLTPC
jgi:disulfide bond formation protein DsbB